MRLPLAIAAAGLLAGFTVQEAEQVLNGEWAGNAFPIGLRIDASAGRGEIVESGAKRSGVFKIEDVTGGAATFTIAGSRFVAHIRDGGQKIMLAKEGERLTRDLARVR